jgi:hypothetical protein
MDGDETLSSVGELYQTTGDQILRLGEMKQREGVVV